METKVDVMVADIVEALGLDGVPRGCEFAPTHSVELTVEVDDDEMTENVIDMGKASAPDASELNVILEREFVTNLAAAIRRGDQQEAELMLDRLVDSDTIVTEWVQQARYSRAARPQPIRLAKAA
jgi:hypothetical protein